MKTLLFAFISSIIFLASCKKSASETEIPSGAYKGTFQRQTSTGGAVSNVALNFTGRGWGGESSVNKYPALCSGTYKKNSNETINFESSCMWTADFDWTLILSGQYNVALNGDSLNISKDFGNGTKDIYRLKKQ